MYPLVRSYHLSSCLKQPYLISTNLFDHFSPFATEVTTQSALHGDSLAPSPKCVFPCAGLHHIPFSNEVGLCPCSSTAERNLPISFLHSSVFHLHQELSTGSPLFFHGIFFPRCTEGLSGPSPPSYNSSCLNMFSSLAPLTLHPSIRLSLSSRSGSLSSSRAFGSSDHVRLARLRLQELGAELTLGVT